MEQTGWRGIRMLAGAFLLATLLFAMWRFSDNAEIPRSGMHFALVVPEQGGQEWLKSTVEELEADYGLRLRSRSASSACCRRRRWTGCCCGPSP